MKTRKANYEDTIIKISGVEVPLRIYIERRSTIRISLGKDQVIMRVPIFSFEKLNEHIASAKQWLGKLLENDSKILSKYSITHFENEYKFNIFGKEEYHVNVLNVGSLENIGKIEIISGNQLRISIPNELDSFEKKVLCRKLISKILVKKYQKFVEQRVQYWNYHYFKKEVKSITIRYNSTNWGSCSTRNKINISTRSLLLPLEIFDYIIVHELSHLVEMNHSDKFWKVVEGVMPKYNEAENWIKKNGINLDF